MYTIKIRFKPSYLSESIFGLLWISLVKKNAGSWLVKERSVHFTARVMAEHYRDKMAGVKSLFGLQGKKTTTIQFCLYRNYNNVVCIHLSISLTRIKAVLNMLWARQIANVPVVSFRNNVNRLTNYEKGKAVYRIFYSDIMLFVMSYLSQKI